MTMTIREAYAQGSTDLKYAEIPTPALDASILLAHVLKTNRTSLITRGMETISAKDCERYCKLIERRALGECVAYIIGKKEFRGLEFEVNKSVLVPRPDTETLVEASLDIINKNFNHKGVRMTASRSILGAQREEEKKINILDMCTGSGAIIIALKNEIPQIEAYATDISKEALKIANKNSDKLIGKNKVKFFLGDLFNLVPSCEFFLITSNPPYIPSTQIETLSAEVQNEPRLALDGGKTGLDIINRIIEESPNYLQKGGYLLLEAAPFQMEEIKTMLAKRGFSSIQLFKDLSGSDRVIGGRFE